MKYLVFSSFIFVASFIQAQKPYFQQEVNFNISATLDDQAHTLTGAVEMEYINHSPDTLKEIWLHLWGNAFKNRRSAFSKQKLRTGSSRFYFSDEKDLGYFKNLDFSADGIKASWKYERDNPDIAILQLPKPLAPGARVQLRSPYLLKIPASFSRLGHVGTSYQLTQWYPKPAVYDRQGWHPMPYLDMGEFYSEFGSYDVRITLPENYVVGATGALQTPAEIAFLEKKELESRAKLLKGVDAKKDPFPASSTALKTIHYKAEQVHDFAWFADKRFMVLKDTARLENGKSIDCWAMFTNSEAKLWEKGAFYVRRAVEFYSKHVGSYPYPQATAVHSALSAGGGMEYPMITVINDSGNAKSLDEVITHEVGHNWFYGVLASNERDHPYMDEGFNSYYENRYMGQYYGSGSMEDMLPKWLFHPAQNGTVAETAQLLLARERKSTPPDTHSDHFQTLSYGIEVYVKTAYFLKWLEQAVGLERFDAAMKAYYQQWAFKHPYPSDLQSTWTSAGLEVPWFFEAMTTEKQADFALTAIQITAPNTYRLSVKNKGALNAPFSVTALKNGEPLQTQWFNSTNSDIVMTTAGVEAFVIDYDRHTLDIDRSNNQRKVSGFLPGFEALQLKVLAPVPAARRHTVGLLPWLGWNNNDKTMIGAVCYNPPVPTGRFQYYLAPGIATNTTSLVGLADLRYRFFPGGLFPKITLGVSAKSFHEDFAHTEDVARYTAAFDYALRFTRIVPQIKAELKSKSSTFRHHLNARALFIGRENDRFEVNRSKVWKIEDNNGRKDTLFATTFLGKSAANTTIYELRYAGEQKRLPNPFRFALTLEAQSYKDPFDRPAKYLRGSMEWKQDFFYKSGKSITARLFGGYFLQNTKRNSGTVSNDLARASFALNPQHFNDYRFDQVFLGRNVNSGFLSRQVSRTEGGFKNAFGAPFANVVGNSNNYIFSLNLEADLPQRLPFGIPLKPWFDIGYYDDASPLGEGRPLEERLLWSGGLMLSFGKGMFEVYFPLANSKYLKSRYCEQSGGSNETAIFCGGNYRQWISWSLNLPFGEPGELLERLIR